jgi:hypothetical protein
MPARQLRLGTKECEVRPCRGSEPTINTMITSTAFRIDPASSGLKFVSIILDLLTAGNAGHSGYKSRRCCNQLLPLNSNIALCLPSLDRTVETVSTTYTFAVKSRCANSTLRTASFADGREAAFSFHALQDSEMSIGLRTLSRALAR